MAVRDCAGNELKVGDTIAYATTRFRSVVNVVATIISFNSVGAAVVNHDGNTELFGALDQRAVKIK